MGFFTILTFFKLVYVPLNARNINERHIDIVVVTNTANFASDWKINVNQLDCPFSQTRPRSNILSDEINTLQTFEKPARSPRGFHFDWVAPAGCLQYHPEPEGTIESFNYNNAQGTCQFKLSNYSYFIFE